MANRVEPLHPGEILLEEFIRPMGITQYRLARDTSVPARRINEIVQGQRGISADTALRLARFFGTSEMFWLNLQARYLLDVEKHRLGDRLSTEVTHFTPSTPARHASARRATASRTGTFLRQGTSKKSAK